MPTRSATSRTRSLLTIVLLLAGLALAGAAQAEQRLTLDQARALAVQALRTGQPQLTLQVSEGLLQANPRDPGAHFLMAHAYASDQRPRAGRRAAARAYRFSDDTIEKYQAAQLAAQLAYAEKRHTLAQIWLRRTAIHAPSEEVKALVARDYRQLRAENPWFMRIRGDLRPSSNVNNGADTALQIIDGVPVTGTLNGAAQALSGVIGTFDIFSSYRLRGDARSATTLAGRLFVQRIALSSEAQAQAPMLSNSDFNSTYGELSLRHAFTIGPAERGGTAAVQVAYGTSWYGGERSYDFWRLGGERRWRLPGGQALQLDALIEDRHNARFATNDAEIYGLGAQLIQPLQNGDRLNLTLALRDTDAKRANGTFQSASLRAAYDVGRPVGPVLLSAGVVLGYSDYPVFRSGLFYVPGGRQDTSIYGDVNMLFDRLDYAGFAPMLRLRAGRKTSNDSRYDIREFSVSLGIESKF